MSDNLMNLFKYPLYDGVVITTTGGDITTPTFYPKQSSSPYQNNLDQRDSIEVLLKSDLGTITAGAVASVKYYSNLAGLLATEAETLAQITVGAHLLTTFDNAALKYADYFTLDIVLKQAVGASYTISGEVIVKKKIGEVDMTDSALVAEFATKQDVLESTVNIKSINGTTLLGSGDLVIGDTALTDITITIDSGTLDPLLKYHIVQPQAVMFNSPLGNNFISGTGKWITPTSSSIAPGACALTFTDLVGWFGDFSIGCTGTTGLTFSELKIITGAVSLTATSNLAIYSFPKLAYVNSALATTTSGTTPAGLTAITFPELLHANGYTITGLGSVTIVEQAKMKMTGVLTITTCPELLTTEFPAIERITSITINSGTAKLATFTLGSNLKVILTNIVISSCALNVASVNALLASLVALDGTNGTTLYTGAKTVTITGTSAVPTGQGLTDKATLAARGISITTNV